MIGWWEELEQGRESLPVTTTVEEVKVTTYVRKVRPYQMDHLCYVRASFDRKILLTLQGHSALIILANFGTVPASATLSFNWTLLGAPSQSSAL